MDHNWQHHGPSRLHQWSSSGDLQSRPGTGNNKNIHKKERVQFGDCPMTSRAHWASFMQLFLGQWGKMMIWNGLFMEFIEMKKKTVIARNERPKYCQKRKSTATLKQNQQITHIVEANWFHNNIATQMHTFICCTWQPDMTPSPPAHTMVLRAMLPHHSGREHTECSTTVMGATCRMAGALP